VICNAKKECYVCTHSYSADYHISVIADDSTSPSHILCTLQFSTIGDHALTSRSNGHRISPEQSGNSRSFSFTTVATRSSGVSLPPPRSVQRYLTNAKLAAIGVLELVVQRRGCCECRAKLSAVRGESSRNRPSRAYNELIVPECVKRNRPRNSSVLLTQQHVNMSISAVHAMMQLSAFVSTTDATNALVPRKEEAAWLSG